MTLLLRDAATAEDLTGRVILSYQLFGSEPLDSRAFLQLYDASYQRSVSDALRFRVSFRGEGTNIHTEFPLFQTRSKYWQLQPSAEVDYLLPKVQVRGTYDLYDTTSTIDAFDWKQTFQRITESLAWIPDRAPSLSLQGLQLRNKQPSSGIDESESLFYEALTYGWNGLTVGQAANFATFDMGNGFSRTYENVQGLAKYDGLLFGGDLNASANAVFGWTRLDEKSLDQGASAPTRVPISTALLSHDETPTDSRDVAPQAVRALIDGDLRTGAGLSLGMDGFSFENVDTDLGRYVGLDTFLVYVRDPSGNPIQFGGLIQWDVYTSGGNSDWIRVPGQATVRFLTSSSAYEISFPKTTARLFKIVNFGTNTIPTLVTEIEAYFHTEFGAQETHQTDIRFVSASASLSATVAPWLRLSYYGNFNDYNVLPGGVASYGTFDNDQLISAFVTASKHLNLTLRAERQRADGENYHQAFDGAWAIAEYVVNPNLTTALEASRTENTSLADLTSSTLRFHSFARFLPTLNLNFDLGVTRNRFALEGAGNRQYFLNAVSYAQLTSTVQLTLSANLQRTTNDGAYVGSRELRYQNYYGEITYRPSPKLFVSGRFGYVVGQLVSASTRRFRVEWYPFAGGSVGIGTIYDDDVDTDGGFRRFRRLQILPQWILNPNVVLSLNYNLLRFENSGPAGVAQPSASARQFFVTLTVTR